MDIWEKAYSLPLEKIPWEHTPCGYFERLILEKKILGDKALDLGCGTGKQTIMLVEKGNYKHILGIDIAKSAIKHAIDRATGKGLSDRTSFEVADVIVWLQTHKEEYDLVLDWAFLHCLKPELRNIYIQNIARFVKKGGMYLLRTFTKQIGEEKFMDKGLGMRIYFIYEDQLPVLFPEFVVEEIQYEPQKKGGSQLMEVLLRKI